MSDAVDLLPAASGAADVAAKITALGTVTDCKRETYLALQEIEAAYAGLTAEEQAEVTNYGDLPCSGSRPSRRSSRPTASQARRA